MSTIATINLSQCDNLFTERMEEIDKLLTLMPNPPSSTNVKERQSITRAAIVLLCGHFEGFLQDLMEEFIEEVNKAKIPFKYLPPELYVQHVTKGKVNNLNLDYLFDFIKEFKTLENSNIPIILSKNSFNKTESNPTADLINKLFRLIGYENIIDQLNQEVLNLSIRYSKTPILSEEQKRDLIQQIKQPTIVEYILDYISNTRQGKPEKKHGFYNDINQLLKLRNEVAHGSQLQISDYDIVQLKQRIELLVQNLIDKANDRIHYLTSIS